MWSSRVARQLLNTVTRSAAAASCSPASVSAGKAAVKAAASCSGRQAASSAGLASSAGFQAFKQGMGARSMGFAASASGVRTGGGAPASFMGSCPQPQVGGGAAVCSSGEGSDDDSSPTNTGSNSASSSSSGVSGDEDEESSVKKRRTKARRRRRSRGLHDLAAASASVTTTESVSATAAETAAASVAHSTHTPSFFFGPGMSLLAQRAATTHAAFTPAAASTHSTARSAGHARALHTGSALLHAVGPPDSSSSRRGGGFAGGGARPPPNQLAENLIFSKESFLKKPEGAIPIPAPIRVVMYQHRWDKLLVDVRRAVSYVRTEGKREQYTAMVAVGNMKGLFGLGLGDAPTAQEAVAAAYLDAFNKLTVIPLYRSHTIFNHIEHKYNSLKFLMSPRQDGWGITANDLLLELCNLAGIRNISIKVYGRNRPKFYVAAGFLEALQRQTVPHDGVEGSGIYVRETLPTWSHVSNNK